VPEIPDQPEDQKRTEEQRRLAGALHSVDCGWNCGGHGIMQTVVDRKYDQMADAALRHLKIGEQEKAAYRAGREDLLRSGSCPECTAGDPHNEPDVPHIHLTPYGYLLYAADHERPGFIEEIRAVERRAGREDAARDILAALRQREDAAHETYARRQALGVGDQAAEWAVRSRTWRQARQAADEAAIAVGDGVQPTEEQRAEDQERDEGQG
jgi:hypothetical protein